MSSRAPWCAGLAVCALVAADPAAAQERTAREIVEAIVRDGPRALAIRAEGEVVRREQQARLARPNPGLSWSREGAGFTEFFQVEQPLPAFGLRAALTRAGVAATAAADADRDARLWELRAEAARLVTRWIWSQARVEATSAELTTVERLVDVLRVREREGDGSRFDRLRAEQEVAELRQQRLAADIDVADARGAVLALLPSGVSVTVVAAPTASTAQGGLDRLDVGALLARAQQARADVRALHASTEGASLEGAVARGARRPAPVVSGGLKRADTGLERELGGVVGLSLSIPLFDTGTREAARWSAEGARLAAERAALEQQVRADVTRAADALLLRQRAVASAGADNGAELVATAEVAYREGEVGLVVLLDAVRTASRARMRDLERRLDLRLAEVALERAVGEVLWP